MKHLMLKLASAIASLAVMATTLNVNSTCMLIAHQAKMPVSAQGLRKF